MSTRPSIGNENFIFFVKKIAKNPAHDLYEFAKSYDEDGWLSAFKQELHPFAGMERFRQLLAEWFREKHPDRAQQIVNDPFLELGINSPRTELLPKRLYRYLGQICLAHGRSFESIMKDLPHKQTGLGTEDCHPRFIACMLRLGDLFDLDDNRFCPVMQKQVGNMPKLSQTHQHKHLALREFLLDRETIKIVAECLDEDSYVETQNWFTWIRQEIQQQMADWKFIVPNRNFGLLPTIEQLEVKLKEGILLDGKPMHFGLDKENTFELFQGGNIYKSDTSVYRELIQNAIDATMMRVWLERGHESNSTNKLPKNAHPFEKKTQEILAEYPITIDFRKIKDDENSDESIWEFSIKDQGVGISENDLKYMQQLAGSSHNEVRQKIINKMPKWMRPSGAFGIGVHSAFLLTKNNPDDQCIRIQTKSIFSHKCLEIVLHSPIGARQGACFIKDKTQESGFGNYGTTLRLKTRVKRRGVFINKQLCYPKEYSHSIAKFLNDNFDPLFQKSVDHILIASTIDNIMSKIASNTPIEIELSEYWSKTRKNIIINNKLKIRNELLQDNIMFSSSSVSTNTLISPKKIPKEILEILNDLKFLDTASKPLQKWQRNAFWSEKYQLYLKIEMDTCLSVRYSSRNNALFKGQAVNENIAPIGFQHLNFFVDFYGTDAKKALTVDRNDWQKEYYPLFKNDIVNVINLLLSSDNSKIETMLRNKSEFSLFVHLFDFEKKYPALHDNEWEKYKFTEEKSIGELLKKSSFTIISHIELDKNDKSNEDTLVIYNINNHGLEFLQKKWYEQNGKIVKSSMPNYSTKYFFTRGNIGGTGEYKNFTDWLDSNNPYHCVGERKVSVENSFYKKFKPLSCVSPLHQNIMGIRTEKSLLLPFLRTGSSDELAISTNNVEKIAAEIWKYRDDEYQNLTQADYASLYNQLIEEVDELMKENKRWVAARERGKVYQCPTEIQAYFDNP